MPIQADPNSGSRTVAQTRQMSERDNADSAETSRQTRSMDEQETVNKFNKRGGELIKGAAP
jgi:hypothetical protein